MSKKVGEKMENNNSNNYELIPSDNNQNEEVSSIKHQIKRLKLELSMLIEEKDELVFVICKNIETQYMLKLGHLEHKAYRLQCKYLKLKRKIELIQARKNRQEKIDIENIEEILRKEFEEYQKEIDEKLKKVNEALERSNAKVLSKEDERELKSTYRQIVKVLHPDINPDATETQIDLFRKAVFSYENGDLQTLRIIHSLTQDISDDFEAVDFAILTEEKRRLTDSIEKVKDEISRTKAAYPYLLKEIIDDPKKLQERQEKTKEYITILTKQIEVYKVKIEEMMR